MARQSKHISDPEVAAANEIYKVAREHADEEMAKLKEEIEGIRIESQAMGILKKIEYDQAHNELLKTVALLKLRESKEYKKGGLTWEQFCTEVLGEPKRTIDERIADVRPLLDDFGRIFAQIAGMPFSKIRLLGRSIGRESAQIEDGTLLIDGEKIPLTPEHKDEIEAAIDALRDSHKKEVEEKDADIRAKNRVITGKEKKIQDLSRDLAKLEGKAERAGYLPGEEAFLAKMSTALLTIDGFLMDFDPEKNPLPEDATPRMKASYMETLGYFKRVTDAAFDTASDLYGDPEIDDDWVPPHKRDPKDMPPEMRRALGISDGDQEKPGFPPKARGNDEGTEERQELGACSKCRFRKGMGNKAHGVKIPGGFGKCTRPEGHCNPLEPNPGIRG